MEEVIAAAAYLSRIQAAFPGGFYLAPDGEQAGRYMVPTRVTMDGDTPVIETYGPSAKSYDIAFEQTDERPDGTWAVQTDLFGAAQIRPLTSEETRSLAQALEEMNG